MCIKECFYIFYLNIRLYIHNKTIAVKVDVKRSGGFCNNIYKWCSGIQNGIGYPILLSNFVWIELTSILDHAQN